METKVCPGCGARYVDTVTACAECGLDLVEDRPAGAGAKLGEGDQVAYDLADWDPDDRVLVDRLLTSQDIAHVWEVATLVVRREDEERVDGLLDDMDAEVTAADLDPDQPQLAYELEGWTDEQREELDAELYAAGIAHAWEDETGDLVVYEADEEAVEQFLDRLEFPDALESADAEEGGPTAQDAMSALFVAADKLKRDPSDPDGVLEAVDAAGQVEALDTPFGFADDDWRAVVEASGELRGAIEGDADDDAVVERATAVRDLLRRYV